MRETSHRCGIHFGGIARGHRHHRAADFHPAPGPEQGTPKFNADYALPANMAADRDSGFAMYANDMKGYILPADLPWSYQTGDPTRWYVELVLGKYLGGQGPHVHNRWR